MNGARARLAPPFRFVPFPRRGGKTPCTCSTAEHETSTQPCLAPSYQAPNETIARQKAPSISPLAPEPRVVPNETTARQRLVLPAITHSRGSLALESCSMGSNPRRGETRRPRDNDEVPQAITGTGGPVTASPAPWERVPHTAKRDADETKPAVNRAPAGPRRLRPGRNRLHPALRPALSPPAGSPRSGARSAHHRSASGAGG
jgi:hypothetical protein